MPAPDHRFRLDPAVAIRLVVVNLLTGPAPLYRLGEWASGTPPACSAWVTRTRRGSTMTRVGWALVGLFDPDRARLLTELIVGAGAEFGIDNRRDAQRLDLGIRAPPEHRRGLGSAPGVCDDGGRPPVSWTPVQAEDAERAP